VTRYSVATRVQEQNREKAGKLRKCKGETKTKWVPFGETVERIRVARWGEGRGESALGGGIADGHECNRVSK